MRRWRQAMIRPSCRQRCGECSSPRWCASLATSSSGWTAIQVRLSSFLWASSLQPEK